MFLRAFMFGIESRQKFLIFRFAIIHNSSPKVMMNQFEAKCGLTLKTERVAIFPEISRLKGKYEFRCRSRGLCFYFDKVCSFGQAGTSGRKFFIAGR